jgi:hypothetical protein
MKIIASDFPASGLPVYDPSRIRSARANSFNSSSRE